MLVSFNGVGFSYADNLIIKNAEFQIHEGERVALIGANGEGKTTLIKLLTGELIPDCGEIVRKNGMSIGYLEQNGGYTSGNTVYEEALKVFTDDLAAVEKLEKLSAKIAEIEENTPEYARVTAQIESLNKYISARECFDTELKIKRVLYGMGFEGFENRVIDGMSGGEKTKFKLARLLLEQPDLLILDEPTNHLDVKTLFWLEEFLLSFKGAVLVVSHDRYFLDKTAQKTVEIENKTVSVFTGNYSKYKILKAERNERLLKDWEAQEEKRKKLQEYVDKNIVRATTAKSAQSRVKQIEKLNENAVEKPFTPPAPPKFNFTYTTTPYENVLTLDKIDVERGGKRLICGGKLQILRGMKVALVGANGTGKSSLLKEIISGNPAAKTGRFVKVGYYDQEAADIDRRGTVLDLAWQKYKGATQTEVRSALARCGLFAEDMTKKAGELSGGELAKFSLCLLEGENANFLILDEPTNHLDLPARESLESALSRFDGTLLFVSHDRYFISALAQGVAEIEDGKLNFYNGDYSFYTAEKSRLAKESAAAEEAEKREAYAVEQKERFRSKKERAEEARRRDRAKKIEAEICALESEEESVNISLADPSIASNYEKVKTLLSRAEEIKTLLDALYKEYETVI